MKIEKVTEEFAADCFKTGIDCSQIVLGYAAPKVGLDSDTALKVSAAFGGGMWCGRTCGAVSGALMAIGMKYGYSEPNSPEQKNAMMTKKAEFEKKFTAAHGSAVCKDILGGLDLSKPEEMNKIMEKNLLFTLCPKVVCTACKILDETL
jgi:C_GCAxxG_C_C family probable redox protein